MDSFALFKQRFDAHFINYLEQKISTVPVADSIPEIGEQMIQLFSEGKRLRPYIAFTASGESIEKLPTSPLLHILYGIELYHIFALIHDDIIDQSDTRHGLRTLHLQFGTAIAILLGDLCLSWAHECIATYYDSLYLSVIFSALSEETIIGQLLETTITTSIQPSLALLDRIIELKTARYTFIYPIFIGRAYVAGAAYEDTAALVRFGRSLGHAFQRIDNMADIFLEAEYLGKEPCTDFCNGVPTHLSLFMQEWGSVVEQGTFSMLFGNRDASVSGIRTLIITSGAYAYEKRMIRKLIGDAKAALDTVPDADRWMPCVMLLESKFNMF